jgi:hypothetical protein
MSNKGVAGGAFAASNIRDYIRPDPVDNAIKRLEENDNYKDVVESILLLEETLKANNNIGTIIQIGKAVTSILGKPNVVDDIKQDAIGDFSGIDSLLNGGDVKNDPLIFAQFRALKFSLEAACFKSDIQPFTKYDPNKRKGNNLEKQF